ncbi:hypothetical protein NHQ30_004469 [Ciborinia camelliae]|nr:hypothetical protein NHQ30_004469 [Ciborinia camelliae]
MSKPDAHADDLKHQLDQGNDNGQGERGQILKMLLYLYAFANKEFLATSYPSHSDLISRHTPQSPKTFHRFRHLPIEIQCKIFEESLPSPCLLDFDFSLGWSILNRFTKLMSIKTNICKFPGVLSLLETCRDSNDWIYHVGFKKLELFLPEAGQTYKWSTKTQKLNTTYYYSWEKALSHSVNYSYIRPSLDTFLVNMVDLVMLYQVGGSISHLSSLTHIAVKYDEDDDEFERYQYWTEWREPAAKYYAFMERNDDSNYSNDSDDSDDSHNEDIELDVDLFEHFFDTIGEHCQKLEKLTLVIGETSSLKDIFLSGEWSTRNMRLVEIDNNFRNLDLVDDSLRRTHMYGDEDTFEDMIEYILDKAEIMMDEFKEYLERKRVLDKQASVNFWRKVKVVPALMGFMENGNEPKLWLPALCGAVACNEHGRPLRRR